MASVTSLANGLRIQCHPVLSFPASDIFCSQKIEEKMFRMKTYGPSFQRAPRRYENQIYITIHKYFVFFCQDISYWNSEVITRSLLQWPP